MNRVCFVDGCEKPHSARGWCNTHYQRWRVYGDPLFQVRVFTRNLKGCEVRGCAMPLRFPTTKWCAKHYHRWYRHGDPTKNLLTVHEPPSDGLCVQCRKVIVKSCGVLFCSGRCAYRHSRGRSETSTACAYCGAAIPSTRMVTAVFCNRTCRSYFVGRRIDLVVLGVRDGWRCHICKKKVKRKVATADHLVPVSYGGPTTMENVALAHWSCNSRRGAGRIPAQLRLIG